MQRTRTSRRRFLAISAALTATAAWPGRARAGATMVEWRGVALGANASIRLAHPDAGAARQLLRRCVAEIERLEKIFSLYLPDSEVCRLNAAGRLELPSLELVDLLSRAAAVSVESDGVFDVTVQPLWQRHAAQGADFDDLLPLVDWRAVSVDADRIAFARRGMAITLNGIAQGYITDRVADLLRAEDMTSVLVDLGEIRALGGRPDGTPWRVGLADPVAAGRVAAQLDLRDMALATSGGYGTPLDPTGQRNHLIDPRSGCSAPARRSVSVMAPRATVADAASTALALLPETAAPRLLRGLGATAAYFQDEAGLRRVRA